MAAGVLARVVRRLAEAGGVDPGALSAWLGPCIGPRAFEVGDEVREAFGPPAHRCFQPHVRLDGSAAWLCDLPGLARLQLADAGVTDVHGGRWCTVEDGSDFFSFRRDRVCGRQAAVVCRLA
jgi:copper oxidase (laccase) domain-containing protein